MRTDDVLAVMHELVTFVRAVEAGSFSAAARQHGLTPSAVSRQVARLEQALGVTLLQRSTRQLRLTEAGLDVLARGREMLAAAQASLRVAEGHVEAPRGLVRLSAPKAVARQLLHQPLLDFLQRHPQVDVHLMVVDRPVDPLREGVDLVLRMTDTPPPGLVARPLRRVRQCVLASPAYLAKAPPLRTPEDLTAHSCLSLGEQAHDHRWRFSRARGAGDSGVGDAVGESGAGAAESVVVPVSGRYTINHSEMRLAAIEQGLGVGCVPDFGARQALAAGRVVQVLADWHYESDYQGMAWLLFAPSRHLPPKVRVLIDHLVAALQPAD